MRQTLRRGGTVLAVPAMVVGLAMTPASGAVEQRGTSVVDEYDYVPCFNGGQGEMVHTTGTVSWQYAWTENQNRTSEMFQQRYQGVSAVGMTSGMTYRLVGSSGYVVNMPIQSIPVEDRVGAWVLTQRRSWSMSATGAQANAHGSWLTHYTLNANGEVTEVDHEVYFECPTEFDYQTTTTE